MSPLSVVRALHYIKEAELGHNHIFMVGSMGGVKYLPLDTVRALKIGSVRFGYCSAFCLLTTALTTEANCLPEHGPL